MISARQHTQQPPVAGNHLQRTPAGCTQLLRRMHMTTSTTPRCVFMCRVYRSENGLLQIFLYSLTLYKPTPSPDDGNDERHEIGRCVYYRVYYEIII